MFHSINGGTGAGFGALMLERMSADYGLLNLVHCISFRSFWLCRQEDKAELLHISFAATVAVHCRAVQLRAHATVAA